MSTTPPFICVVDDDPSVRRALGRLLRSFGLAATAFGSASELLADERRRDAACFVLDIQLPETNGFELARRLATEGTSAPVIFITAHREGTTAERASASGGCLLAKPFDDRELLAALPESVRHACTLDP